MSPQFCSGVRVLQRKRFRKVRSSSPSRYSRCGGTRIPSWYTSKLEGAMLPVTRPPMSLTCMKLQR